MIIEKLNAYWVLDSRGNPTIEVSLYSKGVKVTGSSPSGASTGEHEAVELRDKDKNNFHGKGVEKAINNVFNLKNELIGKDLEPREFDELLVELDGTSSKSKLGGNTTTALSIAFHKLYAKLNNVSLYSLFGNPSFPKEMFNIINGGKHSGSSLSIQEFMIVPQFEKPIQNIKAASEIYIQLKKLISNKYGKISTGVGDEGGFAPPINLSSEAIELIEQSIDEQGYSGSVKISIDSAADSFYDKKADYYFVDDKKFSPGELVDYYVELSKNYQLLSIEDPFFETHSEYFAELKKKVDSLIVGDDITVTNVSLISRALLKEAIDAVIIKINQIGTVSEAIDAINFCKKNSLKRIVSHRSGETEDSFIADFAYGNGVEFIKTGAPARGERTSKYNELIRIEVENEDEE